MNNEQLGEVLNALHADVAKHLRDRLQEDDCNTGDVGAALKLLKQNNIQVTISPELTNHSNQLEVAREKAEKAGSPFGYKQEKKA